MLVSVLHFSSIMLLKLLLKMRTSFYNPSILIGISIILIACDDPEIELQAGPKLGSLLDRAGKLSDVADKHDEEKEHLEENTKSLQAQDKALRERVNKQEGELEENRPTLERLQIEQSYEDQRKSFLRSIDYSGEDFVDIERDSENLDHWRINGGWSVMNLRTARGVSKARVLKADYLNPKIIRSFLKINSSLVQEKNGSDRNSLVLVSASSTDNIQTPLVFIGKYFELPEGDKLSTEGSDLYIIAEKISIYGELSTRPPPAGANQDGRDAGDMVLAALSYDIGTMAQADLRGGEAGFLTYEPTQVSAKQIEKIRKDIRQRCLKVKDSSSPLHPGLDRAEPFTTILWQHRKEFENKDISFKGLSKKSFLSKIFGVGSGGLTDLSYNRTGRGSGSDINLIFSANWTEASRVESIEDCDFSYSLPSIELEGKLAGGSGGEFIFLQWEVPLRQLPALLSKADDQKLQLVRFPQFEFIQDQNYIETAEELIIDINLSFRELMSETRYQGSGDHQFDYDYNLGYINRWDLKIRDKQSSVHRFYFDIRESLPNSRLQLIQSGKDSQPGSLQIQQIESSLAVLKAYNLAPEQLSSAWADLPLEHGSQ